MATTLYPTAQKNPYDSRRQTIKAEGEEDSQRQQEALRNSLVGAGVSDSGIALGQQRTQDRDLRMETGRRLSAVDVEQAANEEENNRELQRQGYLTSERIGGQDFSASESAKARALQEQLGMGGLDLQKQGLAQNKELTLGSQALQKQGLDQSATSDAARLALERELGTGSQAIQREGLAQNKELTLGSQGLQKYGIDKSSDQSAAALALQRDLGLGGLDLQKQGLAQNKELTLGSQAIQREGLQQNAQQFNASQAQAKELAMQGFSLQQSAQALQQQGMNQEDARYYAGLGQAKALAEKGLDLQAVSLNLQQQGMDQQAAQFAATQALTKSENAANRASAQDLQGQALAAQSGENAANRAAAANLQNSSQTFQSGENSANRAADAASQQAQIQAGMNLAQFNATHQETLTNLNASLQKDYATFEDAINDMNRTGDQADKLKLLGMAEKIAGLDPKTDPNFQANIDRIIAGLGLMPVAGAAGSNTGTLVTTPGSSSPASPTNPYGGTTGRTGMR